MENNLNTNFIELQKFAVSLDKSAKIKINEYSKFIKLLNFFAKYFNPLFMSHFAITIGHLIYIPKQWLYYTDLTNIKIILAHEILGHVKQYRKCGFNIHPLFGIPFYFFLYCFLFFPCLFAWFRFKFELDAEIKAWKWLLENCETLGITLENAKRRISYKSITFGSTVGSWKYFYPWFSNSIKKSFTKKAAEILTCDSIKF